MTRSMTSTVISWVSQRRIAALPLAVLLAYSAAGCSASKPLVIAAVTAEPNDIEGPLQVSITINNFPKTYTVKEGVKTNDPVRLGYRVDSAISSQTPVTAEAVSGTSCFKADPKMVSIPSAGNTVTVSLTLKPATGCAAGLDGGTVATGGATGSGGAAGAVGTGGTVETGGTGAGAIGGGAASGGNAATGGRTDSGGGGTATGGAMTGTGGGSPVDGGGPPDASPEGPPPVVNPASLSRCMDYDHGVLACNTTTNDGNWALWSVAFSPDGKLLLSAGQDNRIKFWRVEGKALVADGRVLSTKGTIPNHIRLAFSPDGKYLAAGNNTGDMRIFDAATWTVFADLPGHTGRVVGVQFSPDSSKLFSIADDGVRIWSVAGKSLLTARVMPGGPRSLAVSQAGGPALWVAVGMDNRQVALFDANMDNSMPRSFEVTTSTDDMSTAALSFSPDGQMLATGGADGTLWLFNAANKTMLAKLGNPLVATPFEDVNAVAFTPSGRHVAAAIWGYRTARQIGLWDTMTHAQLGMVTGTFGPVAIAISPDGAGIAVGNSECAKVTYCHD